MSKEIAKISLVLENCDSLDIYRKDIGIFYLGGISKSFSRIASNSISESQVASEFYIEIHKDANTNENRDINFSDDEMPFERIAKHQDITQIGLEFEDGTFDHYLLNWEGDSDYENEAQTSVVSDVNGSLFIVVSEKENTHTIFEDELLSKEEFYWEMYRI